MNDGCFHTILLLLCLRNLSMLCFVTITHTPEHWDVEKYNRESCRYISPTQGQLQTSSSSGIQAMANTNNVTVRMIVTRLELVMTSSSSPVIRVTSSGDKSTAYCSPYTAVVDVRVMGSKTIMTTAP